MTVQVYRSFTSGLLSGMLSFLLYTMLRVELGFIAGGLFLLWVGNLARFVNRRYNLGLFLGAVALGGLTPVVQSLITPWLVGVGLASFYLITRFCIAEP